MRKILRVSAFYEGMEIGSDYDVSYARDTIIVESTDIPAFVAEQVRNFTEYLLNSIEDEAIRKDHCAFKTLSSTYERIKDAWGDTYIVCPHCKEELYEKEWNEYSVLNYTCPFCCNELESETES